MNRARFAAVALLALATTGCDQNVVVQRAKFITERNERLDRRGMAASVQLLKRRWTIDGDHWYGRQADGQIIRLDRPEVKVEPIHEGQPFYTGWAGYVTLTALRWQTAPRSNTARILRIRYRATFKDFKNGNLELLDGPRLGPPSPAHLAQAVW